MNNEYKANPIVIGKKGVFMTKFIRNNPKTNILDGLEWKNNIKLSNLPVTMDNKIINMTKTFNWLKKHSSMKITIFGDYDVDGIISSYIMKKNLLKMGFKDVRVRLPKRFTEGYGMSVKAVNEIDEGIVLCIDNGIKAHAAIKAAKDKGLYVIIIDHHLADKELPEADIIVDPHVKANKGSFIEYCAAGLAYKFAQLFNDAVYLKTISTVAAIGTIADVMPLVNENRLLVQKGIMDIEYCPKGLYALLKEFGMERSLTAEKVAFKIAPCFNACGRLRNTGAKIPLELLLSEDTSEINNLIMTINSLNEHRKQESKEMLSQAEQYISANGLEKDNVIIVVLPETKTAHGIVGIVAGKIVEKYNRSAIVLAKKGDILKGSGRAVESHILVSPDGNGILDKSKKYMLGYGGHKAACGLSLKAEKLKDFRKVVNDNAEAVPDISNTVYYDFKATVDMIPQIAKEMAEFEPFGEGFRPLTFKIDLKNIENAVLIGSSVKGAKIPIKQHINAMFFGNDEENEDILKAEKIEAVGTIASNIRTYQGVLYKDYQFMIDNWNKK